MYNFSHLFFRGPHQPAKVPPDHLVTLLETLTTITHYCLLDMAQQAISVGQPLPLSNSNNVVNDTATAGQTISNLFNVFNPYGNSRVSILFRIMICSLLVNSVKIITKAIFTCFSCQSG